MSPHAALVFALGLATLCVMGATVFIVWLLCALAKELYRHLRGRPLRIKNRDLYRHRVTPRFDNLRDYKERS